MTRPKTHPYASVPGYILGCTREIWEDRGLGDKLRRYYAPDCLVRAPSGLTTSMVGVEGDTLATLHQFPDRQLIGEDVIWKDLGDGDFLSSHRLISVMHHANAGRFGAATGRQVKSRIIADCWVHDGVITEEWLVRDGAGFARALGQTPEGFAADCLAADVAAGRRPAFMIPEHDLPSRYRPTLADDPAAIMLATAYRRIWGDRSTDAIAAHYHPGCSVAVPGGEFRNGHADLDRFVIGYLASFPAARLTLHDASVLREPESGVRVSLRWSLDGVHSGWGHFGAPSGAEVHIMGISHATLTNDRIVFEWILADEVAIWTQILSHRATTSPHGGI